VDDELLQPNCPLCGCLSLAVHVDVADCYCPSCSSAEPDEALELDLVGVDLHRWCVVVPVHWPGYEGQEELAIGDVLFIQCDRCGFRSAAIRDFLRDALYSVARGAGPS
jgi:hypothetical protein